MCQVRCKEQWAGQEGKGLGDLMKVKAREGIHMVKCEGT